MFAITPIPVVDPSPAQADEWLRLPVEFSHGLPLEGDRAPQRLPSERTLMLYRVYWNAWQAYLKENNSDTARATALDVAAFLRAPVRPRGRKVGTAPTTAALPALPVRRLSVTTQARYRRVLGRIHQVGYLVGTLPTNVFAQTQHQRESPKSAAFQPKVYGRLLALLEPTAEDPITARDQVLICLQLLNGLTLSESIQARREDLEPAGPNGERALRLRGTRASQERLIQLHRLTCAALDQADTFDELRGCSHLVPKVRGNDGPLGRHAAYGASKAFLKRALAAGVLQPGDLPQDRGCTMLRNSALAAWINDGEPLPVVLQQAGLQRTDALVRLIKFLKPAQRHRVRSAISQESAAGLPGAASYVQRNRS